jgi:hypothetical protein
MAAPLRRSIDLLLRLLLIFASLVIALQTDLIPKLLRSLAGWASPQWPPQATDATPLTPGLRLEDGLHALYTTLTMGQPLLPWLIWIGAAGGLLALARPAQSAQQPPRVPLAAHPRHRLVTSLLTGAALLAILGIGFATRAANLLPDSNGTWPASNFDEQVYYTNARLLAQGELPYRDHFLAHPPGVAYALAPGLAAEPAWGGPDAFGAARQWTLLFSLAAIPLIFLAGRRLGGNGSGLLAAAVLALDGRVAGVAVLETLVNFWSLVALVLYLYIPHALTRRQYIGWVLACGICCAAALLTKIPGLAIAGALPLHALLRRRFAVAAGLVAATLGVALLGVLPFLLLAPGALVRQTVFFQLLRPQEVRPGLDQTLRIAAYPESLLTTLLAAVGLGLLAAAVWRATRARPASTYAVRLQDALTAWLVAPLWALPVLAVFVFGRSYHAPYYVQWAPPLALLAGAICARPVWRALLPGQPRWRVRLALAGLPLAALALLPIGGTAWAATFQVPSDTVYLPAGAAVRAATGPHDPVLSFDPGYTFVAGRPPAVVPGGGRLVDSAGYMTYAGLGIDRRPYSDLLAHVLRFDKSRNAPEIFQSAPAQAGALGGFWTSRAVVVDGKIGLPQLRGQTLALLDNLAADRQTVEHVTIYALDPTPPQSRAMGPLTLRALTLEPLNPDGSGAGAALMQDGPTDVAVQPGQVLQLGCYWQARPGAPDARIAIRLTTATGESLLQIDQAPDQDQAATHLWNPAFVYPDLHNLPIPPTLPPGTYGLQLGVNAPADAFPPVALPVRLIVGP